MTQLSCSVEDGGGTLPAYGGTGGTTGLNSCTPACAVFTHCQQSHPFDERRVPLSDELLKIGRSVARIRPMADNAIFDCKVLSRNHAVMTYDDGRFYIKDTKSSNGTFINNQRLSKGGEESPLKEVFSGDIIQFGVDIMENSKKGLSVTHGCIVAMVRLYHASGQEATQRCRADSQIVGTAEEQPSSIGTQELYQLQQYIKEASYREQQLEQKLGLLQSLLLNTQEASDNSWQALIDEDRLLSRIELLESQLQLYSKNSNDDKLRDELTLIQEEKHRCECQAKESLRKALEEKIEAVQKLADVERSLENTEEECSRLRSNCEYAEQELNSVALKHNDAVQALHDLSTRLEDAEQRCRDYEQQFVNERCEYDVKINDTNKQHSLLTAKIEALQGENDFANEQIAAMKIQVDKMKEREEWQSKPLESTDDQVIRLEQLLKNAEMQCDDYKAKLDDSMIQFNNSKKQVVDLEEQLNHAKVDLLNSNNRVNTLEDQLTESTGAMEKMVEAATTDLKKQLQEINDQKQKSYQFCCELEDRVKYLEDCLRGVKDGTMAADDVDLVSSVSTNTIQDFESGADAESNLLSPSSFPQINSRIPPITSSPLQGDNKTVGAASLQAETVAVQGADEGSRQRDIEDLQTQLAKSVQAQRLTETELLQYKQELDHSRRLHTQSQDDLTRLKRELITTRSELTQTKAVFEERMAKEQERRRTADDLVSHLRIQIQDLQTNMKYSHSESEQLKDRIKKLTEEVEYERSLRSTSDLSNDDARLVLHRQAAKNQAEFAALREECKSLRTRVMAVEKDMKHSRKENVRLSTEYKRLQESYRALETLKDNLEEHGEQLNVQLLSPAFRTTMSDGEGILSSPRRHQSSGGGVYDPNEVLKLRRLSEEQRNEITLLRTRTVDYEETEESLDFDTLSLQTKTLASISFIPILFLFLALVVAYLPFFSSFTATSDYAPIPNSVDSIPTPDGVV